MSERWMPGLTDACFVVSLLAVSLTAGACGESSPHGASEREDAWRLGPAATADTAGDDTNTLGDAGPRPDTAPTDVAEDGGQSCDPDSACCRYWVDLKVRRSEQPVRRFAGTVSVGDRQVDVECPRPDEAPETYRCNYQQLDRPDDAEPVPSSLRIDAGPRDRSAIEQVEVDLVAGSGSYAGPVDVSPYTVEGAGAEQGDTCRGSVGTASVDVEQNDDEIFKYSNVESECLEDGRTRMTIRSFTDRDTQTCGAGQGPCLTIELTGDDLPDSNKRSGSYRFGPDRPDNNATVCRNGECQAVSGIVVFDQVYPGEAAGGYWRAELPDGQVVESNLSASAAGVAFSCE